MGEGCQPPGGWGEPTGSSRTKVQRAEGTRWAPSRSVEGRGCSYQQATGSQAVPHAHTRTHVHAHTCMHTHWDTNSWPLLGMWTLCLLKPSLTTCQQTRNRQVTAPAMPPGHWVLDPGQWLLGGPGFYPHLSQSPVLPPLHSPREWGDALVDGAPTPHSIRHPLKQNSLDLSSKAWVPSQLSRCSATRTNLSHRHRKTAPPGLLRNRLNCGPQCAWQGAKEPTDWKEGSSHEGLDGRGVPSSSIYRSRRCT